MEDLDLVEIELLSRKLAREYVKSNTKDLLSACDYNIKDIIEQVFYEATYEVLSRKRVNIEPNLKVKVTE